MPSLPTLKPGDTVELIAPASRCPIEDLNALKELLTSWQLNCIVSDNIFGDDLFSANTKQIRFQNLQQALMRPDSKAIICVRGGYGSMHLIPELKKISAPSQPKLFIGMSDITALQIFLQQEWQWPSLHAGLNQRHFSAESIDAIKKLIFATVKQVNFEAKPLNKAAKQNRTINASVTGGNLCIVQTGIGTDWQLNAKNKIVLLEDVNERGYRLDRMLDHLTQAKIFDGAAAIVFGDFLPGNEPDGTSLIQPTLEKFANGCEIPVLQVANIGHGYNNFPMPFGTNARLVLGGDAELICESCR